MNQLKSAQDFEKSYDKFFGAGSFGPLTNFKPQGPIAILQSSFEETPEILERLKNASDIYSRGIQILEPFVSHFELWKATEGFREFMANLSPNRQFFTELSGCR
jgi:hypothetical protein